MQGAESTPDKITEDILKLCRQINNNRPIYVQVVPEVGAEINECFVNVEKIVKQKGGAIVNGWALWKMANILVEAEAHSVWKNEDGDLVDITPHLQHERQILFLPDDKMKYKGENIGNIRMALTESPLVKEYIDLNEEAFNILRKYKPHEKIHLKDLPNRYFEIQDRLLELSILFKSKVGRNDKCPCGSGMKFKKCCGK